jgi:hypothetical protein
VNTGGGRLIRIMLRHRMRLPARPGVAARYGKLNESAARRIRHWAGRRCRLRWHPGVAAASPNRGMTC